MADQSITADPPVAAAPVLGRPRLDLFLISVLILFLELACIRWFPAHVVFLSFFTNTVLLACFLGMSLGCLAARQKQNFLGWTPILLLLGVAAGIGCDAWQVHADVGGQKSPEVVFFGTEYVDPTDILVPIDVVAGLFFLLVTLIMVGPGQELGRALDQVPDRVQAYTINILGSIAGIVTFAAFSWLHLAPLWWFLPVVVGLAYFLFLREPTPPEPPLPWVARAALLGVMLMVLLTSGSRGKIERFWSPYYRIDFEPRSRQIAVNIQSHQRMWALDESTGAYVGHAYPLPHLLNRDSGGKPFQDVLIIGAGSGTDLSRALQWGAEHVDAVEIDPVIQKIGEEHHPNKPYSDKERVSVHINDGRNFLRSTDKKYDLVLFALVDSLILHSGYSNIRLESYLFTKQAFEDVKKRLKPGGIFVVYNYFRQGWIVARLKQELTEVFGEPLVLSLPYEAEIRPDDQVSGHFTVMIAGDTERLRKAFDLYGYFWIPPQVLLGPELPSGFETRPPVEDAKGWERYAPAKVAGPATPLRSATDDWPFLYLRQPMIPELSLRGMLMMGTLALVLLWIFAPRGGASGWSFDPRMFFLGAGFMLIETKAVVHMALLFGSTWMVNSVVFFAVLVMILGANLFVLRVRPEKLWPYYVGLFVALGVNCLVPLDYFLGMGWGLQVSLSCLLVFAPILFAGVIFAVSFGRTTEPDRAFGFNIAGAMLGGLAENSSMLLGFQYLVLVAVVFYALSLVTRRGDRSLVG